MLITIDKHQEVIIRQYFEGKCGGKPRKEEGWEFAYCEGRANGCKNQGDVWGDDNPYCMGSSVCSTALHAGVIGESGGLFLVQHRIHTKAGHGIDDLIGISRDPIVPIGLRLGVFIAFKIMAPNPYPLPKSFKGSKRNGVTSKPYDKEYDCFSVSKIAGYVSRI